jgi:hypothetical protein
MSHVGLMVLELRQGREETIGEVVNVSVGVVQRHGRHAQDIRLAPIA